jgi:hypothetical protein
MSISTSNVLSFISLQYVIFSLTYNGIWPGALIVNFRMSRFKNGCSKRAVSVIETLRSFSHPPLRLLDIAFPSGFTLVFRVIHRGVSSNKRSGCTLNWRWHICPIHFWRAFIRPFSFLFWTIRIASAPTWLGQGHGAFRSEVHEGRV